MPDANRNKSLLALAIVLGGLAAAVWLRRGPGNGGPASDGSALAERYRSELARSENLAGAPEMAALRSGRAFLSTWAGVEGSLTVELGVMGNLNGYASACACSSRGRGGGLAVIGAAVRRWRGGRSRPLLGIGESLLPEGEVPAAYEPLFREKAQLMAELYGQIGVDAFCPSPNDLRAFDGKAGLAEWSARASLTSVVTNLPVGGDSERVRTAMRLGAVEFPITVYSVCDPGAERFRPVRERFALDLADAAFPRCALPPGGVRILVLHDVSLADCVDRIPRPEERTLYVVRRPLSVPERRHPIVAALLREGRLLRPEARGQSLSVLHFLAPQDRDAALRLVAPEFARFVRAVEQDREPELADPAGIRFLPTAIEFQETSATTIGSDGIVEQRLAAHRARVLRRVLASAPYEPGSVPERRRRLLPRESCAGCHEDAVRGWEAGPHAHALTTLLEGERKDQAEVGCVRCHLSATSRLALDAPARTEDHPLRMRSVLSGISCITCHEDVGDEHIEGTSTVLPRKATEAVCRRCHDAVNSPAFDFARYARKLGCCGHAGK